ncbi:hypothetical protein TNCV_977171 [Trichonephila clavipes]|nr:hypothetical protein TNCV_977171 [Trichonephila clavipes]
MGYHWTTTPASSTASADTISTTNMELHTQKGLSTPYHHVEEGVYKSIEAQISSPWCDVEVRRRWCYLWCLPRHLTMVQNDEVRHQKPSSN